MGSGGSTATYRGSEELRKYSHLLEEFERKGRLWAKGISLQISPKEKLIVVDVTTPRQAENVPEESYDYKLTRVMNENKIVIFIRRETLDIKLPKSAPREEKKEESADEEDEKPLIEEDDDSNW